jgi:hypothetical protein
VPRPARHDAAKEALAPDEWLAPQVTPVEPGNVVRDEERSGAAEYQRPEVGSAVAVEADQLAVQNRDAANGVSYFLA